MGIFIIPIIFDHLDELADIKHADKEDYFLGALDDQNRQVDYDAYLFFPLPDGILYYFLR